jgi:serine/arginine repetitive matrix protein 1
LRFLPSASSHSGSTANDTCVPRTDPENPADVANAGRAHGPPEHSAVGVGYALVERQRRASPRARAGSLPRRRATRRRRPTDPARGRRAPSPRRRQRRGGIRLRQRGQLHAVARQALHPRGRSDRTCTSPRRARP